MITLIEARTPQGTLLSLPLEDASSGIAVQKVAGLDPVKATVVSSGFASMDGAQFQSVRRETRNIVLTLSLRPDYLTNSVRELRKRLYAFFSPKGQISLRFHDSDDLVVDIAGVVEYLESDFFVQEPTVEISVICFDPDFVETTPIVLAGNTVNSTTESLIQYDGEIETGFVFTLNINRTLTEFTIYNRPEDNVTQSLDVAASLVSGDVLTISTVAGDKGITLTRAGVESSLLYGMSVQSTWIELLPGDNHFRVYATGAAIPYSLTYSNRYGGL